jgi:hypothetical protein
MLDPNVNGFLLWTVSQYLQDWQEGKWANRPLLPSLASHYFEQYGGLTMDDLKLAVTCYPGREMPDESIFPIPEEDMAKIRALELVFNADE